MIRSTFDFDNYVVHVSCSDINEYQETVNLKLRFFDDECNIVEGDIELVNEVEEMAKEKLYEEKYERGLSF